MYFATAVLSLSALVGARQMAKDQVKAAKLYDSGVRHRNILSLKEVCIESMVCIVWALISSRSRGATAAQLASMIPRSILKSRISLLA
jgi:hypothetical protein